MLLYYPKNIEKELRIYGTIINVFTLSLFNKWVTKKFFSVRENFIIKHLTQHYQLELHEHTIQQIMSGNLDNSNIRFRHVWDPNENIIISLNLIHGYVFIYKGDKLELSFGKNDSEFTENAFWYYRNQKDLIQRKLGI